MRNLFFIAIILLGFTACTGKPSESRVVELIRLNYRQQSLTAGEGKWLIDSVFVDEVDRLREDTFRIRARISGLYQLPEIEDTPVGYTEQFRDTVEFKAWKQGKIWTAEDWVIVGSSHE